MIRDYQEVDAEGWVYGTWLASNLLVDDIVRSICLARVITARGSYISLKFSAFRDRLVLV